MSAALATRIRNAVPAMRCATARSLLSASHARTRADKPATLDSVNAIPAH